MGNKVLVKDSKKLINAWCSYDMANSAYSLCVATVLYPVFFEGKTSGVDNSGIVNFFGVLCKNTVLYEFSTAMAYLIAIVLVLLLSGVADLKGYRKIFLQAFTLLGGLSCIGMYWFNGDNLYLGVVLPMLAIIAFTGSFVYYNSFLPDIVTRKNLDKTSARGYAFGYAGSMLLLIFILIQVQYFEFFQYPSAEFAVRIAFVQVGLWWVSVGQIAIYNLSDKPCTHQLAGAYWKHGLTQIAWVFTSIKKHKEQSRYLLAFFLFSVGVQSIMIMASLFGAVELGMEQSQLIIIILLVQITGIIGAFTIGKLSDKFGDKQLLIFMLLVWLSICVTGFFIQSLTQFLFLAAAAGFVMAGIQAQSRAIWSKFVPNANVTASYFGFYDSAERLALVVGMLFLGLIDLFWDSLRTGMMLLALFFLASLFIVLKTNFTNSKQSTELN